MNCVNIKSKDFISLLEETKLPSMLLELRVAKFQEKNGVDSWPKASDVYNSAEVNYQLKSVNLLLSDKAKQVFEKGKKNNWSLDKILTELAIPKEQKQLLLELGIADRDQLISNINPKDGVLELFESNPELASIGTQSQYSEYINTIFPSSKIKDIVYHGTNKSFDKFDLKFEGSNEKGGVGRGFNFSRDIYDTDIYGDIKIYAILNAVNKVQKDSEAKSTELSYIDDVDEIVLYDSEQIHILGSKQDIAGFKEFVGKYKPIDTREQLALELASKYGYNVEVNTAMQGRSLNDEDFIGDPIEEEPGMWYYNGHYYSSEEDAIMVQMNTDKRFFEGNEKTPTQHYSGLTVPGGTNYTENEISTPLITPSIKGHAQFSTDKGIGWFRSDEKSESFYEEDATDSEFIIEGGLRTSNITDSKTRRILEVQSDLFQKGRNFKNLVEFSKIGDKLDTLLGDLENEAPYNGWSSDKLEEEKQKLINKYTFKPDIKQNQFIQLLNKDNNWVTFFIKSIIQDSAKKGYEKVLFPKGETAAKIEGHETLANRIKKFKDNIDKLTDAKSNPEKYKILDGGINEETGESYAYETYSIVLSDGSGTYSMPDKENFIKGIDRQIIIEEQNIQNLKSQGIEKLKPIEAFYEIKVGNILEKQFGKDNVKTITDEYGNQWREITIESQRDLSAIQLQKMPLGMDSEKEYKSADEIYNDIYSKYESIVDKLNIDNDVYNKKSDTYKPLSYSQYVRLSKKYNSVDKSPYAFSFHGHIFDPDYGDIYHAKFELKDYVKSDAKKNAIKAFADQETKKIADGKSDITKPMFDAITQTNSNNKSYSKTDTGTQLNMLDELFNQQRKVVKNVSNEAREVLYAIANDMSNRFGGKYYVVSESEARNILGDNIKENERTPAGFRKNRVSYIVEGIADNTTPIHEIFGHPFVDYIYNTNIDLYNKLLSEATMDQDVIRYVFDNYSDSDPITQNNEIILRAIDKVNKKKLDSGKFSGLIDSVKQYFREFASYIKNLFGIKSIVDNINPNSSIEDISNWIVYGKSAFNIAAEGSKAKDILDSISFSKSMANKSIDKFMEDNNIPIEFRQSISDEYNNRFKAKESDIQYSKKAMDENRPSIDKLGSVIDKLRNGLEIKLDILKRRPEVAKSYKDEIRSLIRDLSLLNGDKAIYKFVSHTDSELLKAMPIVDDMMNKMRNGIDVDIKRLTAMHEEFMVLYSNALDLINPLKFDNTTFSSFSSDERAMFEDQLTNAIALMNDMLSKRKMLLKYQYSRELKKIGMEVGSTTIDSIVENPFESEFDISTWQPLIGAAKFSKSEQIRALNYKIQKIKSKIHTELMTSEYRSRLIDLSNKLKGAKFIKFEDFFEKDRSGKRTGNMIAQLLYGAHYANEMELRRKLKTKYGLASEFDVPKNDDDLIEYYNELDKFHEENSERRFTNEYYRARHSLSRAARDMMDEADEKVYKIRDKYLGEDGLPRTELMSELDKILWRKALNEKRNLASRYTTTGELKSDSDLEVAKEIAEFRKKTRKGLSYKPNFEKFNKRRAELLGKLSEKEMKKWEADNQRVVYDQSWYDSMEKLDKYKNSEDWQALYDSMQEILKFFTNPDTREINVDMMESTKIGKRNAKDVVDEISEVLESTRNREKVSDGELKFGDIAESIESDSFKRKYSFMKALAASGPEGSKEFAEWKSKNMHLDNRNVLVPNRYWMKVVPKDKSLIRIEPNSIWLDIDEESEFLNNNYDESLAENGIMPKLSKYDNRKEFNKIMSDPNKKEFYNLMLDMMAESNSYYSYIERPGRYRLPQMSGGFVRNIVRSDNKLKALAWGLKDYFKVTDADEVFGETANVKYHIDNSLVRFIPTRHRAMLHNTNNISSNLPMLLYSYYEGALHYKHMSEELPNILLLKEGINNISVIGKRENKKAGSTNISKMANDIIDEEIYGSSRSRLGIRMKAMGQHDTKEYRFSMNPLIKDIYKMFRAANLYLNTFSIFANIYSSEANLMTEAMSGLNISTRDLLRAKYEILKRFPGIIASSTGVNNDSKVLGTMRFFDISASHARNIEKLGPNNMLAEIDRVAGYGPYTAGDFLIKSQMLVAILNTYRLYDGKFISRKEFMASTKDKYNNHRAQKLAFSKMPTLYNAIKIDKNGIADISKEYKDKIDDVLINEVKNIAKTIGARIDSTLTEGEKTAMHRSTLGTVLFMHRNYMFSMFNDRFHSEIYSYEDRRIKRGVYRNNISTSAKILLSYLTYWNQNSREYLDNIVDPGQKYNFNRVVNEQVAILFSSVLTIIFKELGDDDEKSVWFWLYSLMLRNVMELSSPYSPQDFYGQLRSPTTSQGQLDAAKNLLVDAIEGTGGNIIQRGKYENNTRNYRSINKFIPYAKQAKESIIDPNPKEKERYLKTNVGYQYRFLNTTYEKIKQGDRYHPEQEESNERIGPSVLEQYWDEYFGSNAE